MFNGIIYQQGTVSKFSKLNAGTKIYIKSKLKLDKKDILYFVMTDPSKPVDVWNSSDFYRMEVWPIEFLPSHYDPVFSNDGNSTPQYQN